MLGLFHYQVLCEVLRDVHVLGNREEIANFVLSKVAQALNSEGGTVFLIDDEGLLVPMAAYGASLKALREHKFPVGQGLVGWVAQFKEPLKLDDVKMDPRFFGAVDLKTGFATRSVVSAPILFGTKVEGVIEFLNKKDGKFSDADLELIVILGREIGVAIEKVSLEESVRRATTLELAVGNLQAGVVIASPHNIVVLANERAKRILATESFDIKDGDSLDSLNSHWPELAYSVRMVIETALAISRQQTEIYPKKIVGYSCVPVTDKEGTVAGAALLLQDITPSISNN